MENESRTFEQNTPRDWRKRAEELFDAANQAYNPIAREAIRRKATAAQNIAESMEYSAEVPLLPAFDSRKAGSTP